MFVQSLTRRAILLLYGPGAMQRFSISFVPIGMGHGVKEHRAWKISARERTLRVCLCGLNELV